MQNIIKEDQIQNIIEEIFNKHKDNYNQGKVADYIPALGDVDPNHYAISVATVSGNTYNIGEYNRRFSIQSISKVFTLAMLANKMGEDIWKHVGKEPSGNSFVPVAVVQNVTSCCLYLLGVLLSRRDEPMSTRAM